MPFKLNEIVEAVDPVKIYEYINFNKNIIMREYLEVERLKNYVYFYNDDIEFLNAIDEIEKNRIIKYNKCQRIEFLRENTWSKRAEKIIEVIGL